MHKKKKAKHFLLLDIGRWMKWEESVASCYIFHDTPRYHFEWLLSTPADVGLILYDNDEMEGKTEDCRFY